MSLKQEVEGLLSQIINKSPYSFFYDQIQTKFTKRFFQQIIDTFENDFHRYYPGNQLKIDTVFLNIPLTGIMLYRISKRFYINGNIKQALFYSNLVRLLSQMEIYYTAEIGSGLKINHGFGVTIGANCKIGDNALIYQNTTIGDINPLSKHRKERPVIGDNIVMYSGAKILGPVKIGDNVIISQNAVCIKSIGNDSILMEDGSVRLFNTAAKNEEIPGSSNGYFDII